jgi:hypothetical protein
MIDSSWITETEVGNEGTTGSGYEMRGNVESDYP